MIWEIQSLDRLDRIQARRHHHHFAQALMLRAEDQAPAKENASLSSPSWDQRLVVSRQAVLLEA